MKEWWKDYFSFTKKERTGALVLMVLIIVLFIAPHFLQEKYSGPGEEELNLISERKLLAEPPHEDSLIEEDHEQFNNRQNYNSSEPAAPDKLFKFDPNTLSDEGWKKLGVKEKVIQTIHHYIEKGGKFRRPEDLKRIYGLQADQADRLILYAEIKNAEPENKYHKKEKAFVSENFSSRPGGHAAYKNVLVDINLADTSAWIALPGIGSKLAARIVNFREKLGGFYSVEQVSETFGLADSVFQKIKSLLLLSESAVKQININSASLDELKLHPYIRWKIATAIVRYREQHGPFTTVNDLSAINIIDDELLKKMKPYLIAN